MTAAVFLQDLSVVLCVAAAILLVFKRLGQPPVLGYLAAGLIVGPHTPPVSLVSDIHSLEVLAEIGVVFLLFSLGVEFNLRRLLKVGVKAVLCAVLEAVLMIAAGYAIAGALGLGGVERFVFGGIVALASTAVVARTLLERAGGSQPWRDLVSGMLIGEDIVAVLLIAGIPAVAQAQSPSWTALAAMPLRFLMLATVLTIAGLLVVPRLFKPIARAGMDEVWTLAVVGLGFAAALLTEKLGFSSALGAFLAGAVLSVGASEAKLHETISPFKDLFGAVFFVSVGMLLDPRWLIEHWALALGASAAVILARAAANFAALAAAGQGPAAAVEASLAMLPIGEFSFILAQTAERHGLAGPALYPLAVTLCLSTTLASSMLLPAAEAGPGTAARVLPRFLREAMEDYHRGLERVSLPGRTALAWRLLQPSVVQIAMNGLGITALFLAAGALRERLGPREGFPGALWMGAAFLSLPFLIALSRKVQAVTLIVLEALTVRDAGDAPPAESRPGLTRLLLGLSTALVAWWYLSLSLALLPSWPYAALPVALIATAAFLLWRRMARVYSGIQAALREAFSNAPETAAETLSQLVSASDPERMKVASLRLAAGSWAAGRSIKETGLRARTGASLLQIKREGRLIAAPAAETLLAEGDELLLIGEAGQIEAAKACLTKAR